MSDAISRGPTAIAVRDESPRELDDATLRRCKTQDPLAFRAFVTRMESSVFGGRGPRKK